MTTPNQTRITLKAVKVNSSFSQETICYSATAYLDGKVFATLDNDGRGGETGFFVKNQDLYEAARVFAKSLPAVEAYGTKLDVDLPFLCDMIVDEMQAEKQTQAAFKRAMKANILFLDSDKKLRRLNAKRSSMNPVQEALTLDALQRKHPEAVILLNLDVKEAYKLYKELSAA